MAGRTVWKHAERLALALAGVACITVLDFAWLHVNSPTAAFTYLLLILGLAARFGFRESIAAAFASVLCYNFFFLPPIGTFTITDPQNSVAFCVFLITAITGSHLSTTAKRRADEAHERRREMEKVYDFSRFLMLRDDQRNVASQIAEGLAEVFQVPEAAFYERTTDRVYRFSAAKPSLRDERLRDAARADCAWSSFHPIGSILPVRFGGRTLGSMGIAGAAISEAALQAVAQLGAIAMERALAQEAANRAEAKRQNERLKAALLDAMAHEFKTPLTSIKAAITAVLEDHGGEAVERELLTIADEEADRLTALVNETIDVARLEAGNLKLHLQACTAGELVEESLSQLKTFREGRDIQVRIASGLPPVEADAGLSTLALRQLIDNALKYSPSESPIRISAEIQAGEVAIEVANDGPAISAGEQGAIFERFYRGNMVRDSIPGTGLGLTIAREIAEAHGGSLTVSSGPDLGSVFRFTLRVAPASVPVEMGTIS